ncbi:MAG: PcfJ domain-containing protein [Mycoplasmataceae bacterium]|nr:PcfJ domain-containing protein [Mycoplasmataceae bacterium]
MNFFRIKKEIIYRKSWKYKLNNFKFFENGISIIPLLTIDDVKKEGLENRHCIYSNCYYGKEDSLLFTSYLNNIKLETIEYSLKEKKVIQCRGYMNNDTEYHEQIIYLANTYITNYLFNWG